MLERELMKPGRSWWRCEWRLLLAAMAAGFLAVVPAEMASGGEPSHASLDLPVLTETSTLSDYLRYAVLSNPGLQAASKRWEAALERIPQARALPDPKLSYGYFIEDVETRVGPQKQRFGLTQTIPWVAKLGLRGKVAEQAANAEQQKLAIRRQQLFYQVKRLYYEYVYLHQSILIAEENVGLLTHLEAVAQTRFRGGRGLQSALLRVQIELEKVKDRLGNLLDAKPSLIAQLNVALNRPADAPLSTPDAFGEQDARDDLDLSMEVLGAWLAADNPELQANAFRVAKERAAVNLAGKNYLPDFTFGVQYIDTDDASNSGMVDSGKDPLIATVAINLPIWFGKYRAAIREAEHQHAAALDESIDLENRLMANLEEAIYRYRDAERRVELYQERLLPMADQSLEVTLQSFATGGSGILDLIDAERVLLDLRLSGARAYTDQQQALGQ